jgi:predicted AlkP superfamily phosphohydrolase/phosphomutase
VIGLDGATFAILDSLYARGELPHLAAFRERGVGGVLESVVPPLSPPAWTTAFTGVNPGKHNIYDFFHMTASGPQALLTSSLDRRARAVWDVLNDAGVRTGMQNIPMTFPPDRVKGFMISGFPFGSAKSGFTYPAELESELGEYPLDLFGESIQKGLEGRLLHQFRWTLERHAAVAKKLMVEEDWDLFWVVFTGTDKVQHFFWKFMDPQHPEYDLRMAAQFGSAIHDFWVRVDEIVGELLEIAGPETDVIILSDHGFGPIYRELRLLNWLESTGFIELNPGQPTAQRVDAFPSSAFGGLIRVNQRGRDYQGQIAPGEETQEVKAEIIDSLRRVEDPVTGEPLADRIYSREELFTGPYVENAPDILFLERDDTFIGRGKPESLDVFGPPSLTFSAYHRPEGIIMAAGPHFTKNSERQHFSIMDVTPTLLWLFDVPAPRDLDGRVMDALVQPDSLTARPPEVGDETVVMEPPEAGELSEQTREVLESLGYVQ